jgi:hypothetical protein
MNFLNIPPFSLMDKLCHIFVQFSILILHPRYVVCQLLVNAFGLYRDKFVIFIPIFSETLPFTFS